MICYIIDDEQHAINNLVRQIEKLPQLTLAGSCTFPVTALAEINRLKNIDLVFLDVDMPDLSGLQVAELLPSTIKKIFTTAHSSYAAKAFDLDAADFLIKPVSLERLVKAINKIDYHQSGSRPADADASKTLFINPGIRGKVIQISLDEIAYIEGLKNYVLIHTTDSAKHITYLTMNEIAEALPYPQFFRIHKSYIVNKEKIKSVEGNRIFLSNGVEFNLGIKYRESFMNFIGSITLKSKRKAKPD